MPNEIIIGPSITSNIVEMSINYGPPRQVTSPIVSAPVPSSALYSNFDTYIVNGVRQAVTYDLVRTNISTSRRIIVTETIVVTSFKFVRIPPDNWSTLGYSVTGTLSIVAGTGATIDGGVSSKNLITSASVYNPSNALLRANNTSQYDIYTVTPTNYSTTTLTAGQYNISLLGTGANMDIATLTTATFPIDTSKKVYPSGSATHFVMEVI
jgi:hypothetical protein